MKNALAIAALAIALVGCSSAPMKPQAAQEIPEQEIGSVMLTYDTDGNWTKLRTVASAEIVGHADEATSFRAATLLARRNISEFLTAGVRSNTTVKSIANNLLKTEGDAEGATRANSLAQTMTENLSMNSSSIQRGVYVSNRAAQNGRAVVELTVTKQTIAAARNAASAMN